MQRTMGYIQGVLLPLMVIVGLVIMGSHPSQAGPPAPPVPNVQVVNPPEKPVPVMVNEAARKPFQKEFDLSIPDGSSMDIENFDVPGDSGLVIEFASGWINMPSDQQAPRLVVDTKTAGAEEYAQHTMTLSRTIEFANGACLYQGSTPTRIYAGPGTTIRIRLTRVHFLLSPDGEVNATFSLSGYLVPVSPSP